MTAVMGFGMFVFSIPTLAYDQLQRRTAYDFATTPRMGARAATQFVGPGDDSLSLSGSAHTDLSDGEASLDQLRAMAAEGEAQPLVCANGRVYGTYVITTIDERHTLFAPDGTPIRIDFGIDLRAVDDSADRVQADEAAP